MDGGERKYLPIDMVIGGESWTSWRFGPYGRARDWRLIAPDGAHYTAGELADVRRLMLDADYLRQRVALLEDSAALYLRRGEAAIIREAVAILDRLLPRRNRT